MSNTALNVDCVEYMKSLPDKAFDLAVVDPPYGDGFNGTHLTSGRRKGQKPPLWLMDNSQIVNVERERASRRPNRRHVGGKVR